MIQLFRPTLGEEELEAARTVFESGWVGRGPRTSEFEQRFADHLGVDPATCISTTSCTEGLFLSMELLGIGEGDEVVMPTISFVGAGNAVAARGAKPVFCDVDRRSLNARLQDLEAVVTENTRAFIPLHYGGLPMEDMEAIARFCSERGIALVEDSACSISSFVGDTACGTFGDLATWSFDAMKILVAGDGGMIYARDPEHAERLRGMTYLGMNTESGFSASASASRWWEFEVDSFSRRQIINDLTAAIALVQLDKLPSFIERRREVHERYDQGLAGLDWLETPPAVPEGSRSSYYFYWLQLEPSARDALAVHLRANDVYTTFRYWPLHRVAAYGALDAQVPEADAATASTLCIPIHQALSDADVDHVIEAIQDFGRAQGLAA